jgi:hypothetical protein
VNNRAAILAKIKVYEIAASWIEDQTGQASSDILNDDDGEYDPLLVKEAARLSKRLTKNVLSMKRKLEMLD